MAQVSLKQLSHDPPNAKRRVGKGGWEKEKRKSEHSVIMKRRKMRLIVIVGEPDDLE